MARPKEAPDGGWGFLVVMATGVCFFLFAGMARCAGVLYSSWKSEFEASAAMTGALASIVLACSHFICPIGAIVCRRLGARVTMILGGLMSSVGLLISSRVQTIYQMYVFFALAGFGLGFVIVAGLVVVGDYFKKYYRAANGVASSGMGIGLVAFPPFLQFLLDTYGWRGTMLITAAITSNICVGGAVFRPVCSQNEVEQPNGSGTNETFAMEQLGEDENERKISIHEPRPVDRKHCGCPTLLSRVSELLGLNLMLRSYSFTLFCWINLLTTVPYICYIVFIFPRASHIGIPDQATSLVLSAFGISSIFGRLVSGFLTNWRFSSIKVFTVALGLCGGGTLLTQFESFGSFLASGSIVGFFTGVTQATTVVVVRKYVGANNIGSGMGICYFFTGVGDLVGPIITGSIFDLTRSYPAVFYFLAALFFAGFLQMMCLPLLQTSQSGCSATHHSAIDV